MDFFQSFLFLSSIILSAYILLNNRMDWAQTLTIHFCTVLRPFYLQKYLLIFVGDWVNGYRDGNATVTYKDSGNTFVGNFAFFLSFL